jgi:hypothetical protein
MSAALIHSPVYEYICGMVRDSITLPLLLCERCFESVEVSFECNVQCSYNSL